MFRSCEDILRSLKPLLLKHACYVTLSDSIEQHGDRYYIKSTATLINGHELSISSTAYAREAETKSTMDESQITGSASSYARKCALCGLFAIDDGKDNDSVILPNPCVSEPIQNAVLRKKKSIKNKSKKSVNLP